MRLAPPSLALLALAIVPLPLAAQDGALAPGAGTAPAEAESQAPVGAGTETGADAGAAGTDAGTGAAPVLPQSGAEPALADSQVIEVVFVGGEAEYRGLLSGSATVEYLVQAAQGDRLYVDLISETGDVGFDVFQGSTMLWQAEQGSVYVGVLPGAGPWTIRLEEMSARDDAAFRLYLDLDSAVETPVLSAEVVQVGDGSPSLPILPGPDAPPFAVPPAESPEPEGTGTAAAEAPESDPAEASGGEPDAGSAEGPAEVAPPAAGQAGTDPAAGPAEQPAEPPADPQAGPGTAALTPEEQGGGQAATPPEGQAGSPATGEAAGAEAVIEAPVVEAPPVEAPAPETPATEAVVTWYRVGNLGGDMLNLRRGPSRNDPVVAQAGEGRLLQGFECQDGGDLRWCRVVAPEDPEVWGWAADRFLTVVDPPDGAGNPG